MKTFPNPSSAFAVFSAGFLAVIGLFSVAEAADRIAWIDNFSESPMKLELTEAGNLTQSGLLGGGSLFAAGARTVLLDATDTPPARRATAEVLDSFSKYFFSVGPGVQASSVLRYEAPPTGPLDLTMGNAANALGFTLDYSQTAVNIEVTVETPGQPSMTVSKIQSAVENPTDVVFPYELFEGVNFNASSAISVRLSQVAGAGSPDLVASGISLMKVETAAVPEPSVALLAVGGLALALRRRRSDGEQ
ncbi:MAG: PEP-CTERM sorting domain-containing protein [Akkermansiaceae bacterium]|jgi:hypothetical protein|nr:PEP-CTERM sorting domain-containing protein [Akkermansiaceae bacterium]